MKSIGIINSVNQTTETATIQTSEYKKFTLHFSNLDKNPENYFIGRIYIIETKINNQQKKVLSAHDPNNYEDFELIITYFLNKSQTTEVQNEDDPYAGFQINVPTDFPPWGPIITVSEEKIALHRQLTNKSQKDLVDYCRRYFDEKYKNKDNNKFLDYLSLILDVIEESEITDYESGLKILINHFIKNIDKKLLLSTFNIILLKTNKLIYVCEEEQGLNENEINFPYEFFITNHSYFGYKELMQICQLNNGIKIATDIIIRQIESIDKIEKVKIDQITESILIADLEVNQSMFKEILSHKLLDQLLKIDYSDLNERSIKQFKEIMQIIGAKIYALHLEEIINSFNNQLNEEIIFRLWQETIYFIPNFEFFRKNYERLKIDDLKYVTEDFYKEYILNTVERLGEIDSLQKLGLLAFLVVEIPYKILFPYVYDKLPFNYKMAYWLNFTFRQSYNNGIRYEADYEMNDFRMSSSDVIEYFDHINNLEEVLIPWELIRQIQDRYVNYTSNPSKNVGFRELDEEKRLKMINNDLANQNFSIITFFRYILYKIEPGNLIQFINCIIPKFLDANSSELDDLADAISNYEVDDKIKNRIFSYIGQISSRKHRISLWIEGYLSSIDLNEVFEEFNNFPEDQQPNLLRKVFSFIDLNNISKNDNRIGKLLDLQNNKNINLNVRICLAVLSSLLSKEQYISEKTISEFVCDYLKENMSELLMINNLFEKCIGRTYLDIYDEKTQWSINVQGKDFLLADNFIKSGDTCIEVEINNETKIVVINKVPINLKWSKKSFHTSTDLNELPVKTFCDAIKSGYSKEFETSFYWCCNLKCYAPNQHDHLYFEWKWYSLRDFIRILKLSYDEDNYYRFVGILNRINRLLEKLKCLSCNHILRDAKSSEFAFYRVTTFHCTNPTCAEFKKVIYLNHCLNWKCLNIVDSRVSVTCPNGWYICDECGDCCSQVKIDKRYNDLLTNNAYNPDNEWHLKLKNQVDSKLGHKERQERFNYKTGQRIDK